MSCRGFGQQYARTELSVINGLGQGDISHISQDRFGYIWITQHHGVSRFNGREFIQLEANPLEPNSLPTTEVYHILHLPDGNAWFSHQKGLSFYNRRENRFTNYDRRSGLHCDAINETFTDGDSILFAAHWYGYDRINLNTFTSDWLRPFPQTQDSLWRHRSPNLPNHPKQNPYNPKQIFSIHHNNLYVLDKATLQFTKLTDFKVGVAAEIKSAFYLLEYEWMDSSQLLLNFFPNQGEVYTYNLQTKKLTPLKIRPGMSLWINKIQKTSPNTFLCVEQTLGPFQINIETMNTKLIDSTFQNRTFTSFFLDPNGVIWVGEHSYAYRYEPTQIVTYQTGPSNIILNHIVDPETGIIIVFTYTDQKVIAFENGEFKALSYPPLEGMSMNTYYHSFEDHFINLTGNFLYIFHPLTNFLSKIKLKGLKDVGTVNDISIVPNGFYAVIHNRVYFIDLEGNTRLTLTAEKEIYDLEYAKGKIYYSTLGHVYTFDLNTKATKEILHLDDFTRIPLLVHHNMLYILWLKKLMYATLDSPEQVLQNSHLDKTYPDHSFIQISASGDDLLISAEFQLIRLNAQTLTTVKVYSYLDQIEIGYWDDVFSTVQGQYYLTTDTRKIIAFPEQMTQPSFLSYQLEAIEINGENKIIDTFPLHFKYDENNIVIKSDAVYTGIFDKLRYYYRNSVRGNQWIEMNSDILQLLSQKPGEYSIDFKVADRFGQEQVIEAALVFEISPPWYQSRMFYVLCILSGIALIFGIYQLRLKQVRKNFDFQSKLQQLEMTALKAQMNPHFIFNCLNSIKGLILIGDAEKAVSYIGTFSKLVRSSLDSAEEKLITLKEELDIAENYLSLERLRYGDRLNWSIRCQDESLLKEIKMPPFILQPLLENAIVHGIKYVDHDGFVHILAYREKSKVIIKIIDNGIGLDRSKARDENNEHSTRKHLGVSLVERRLKIIGASISIYEHKDAHGNTAGTISEIIIPEEHE